MSMELFDANASCLGVARGAREGVDAPTLLSLLKACQIGGALVRVLPADMEFDVRRSNERLFAACASQRHLVPCPVLVPDTAHDLDPEDEQVDAAIRAGAGAGWIRPAQDCWIPEPWVSDRLFRAMEERRLPLFASMAVVSLPDIARIAERFPRLPILVTDAAYRSHRLIQPLLETFGNTYYLFGGAMATHCALEHIVRYTGAERILFGTGAPETEAMCAVTYLMYSALGDGEKALVGGGNMRRLMDAIT